MLSYFHNFKNNKDKRTQKGQVPGERYCEMEIFVQKVYQEEQCRHIACKGQGGRVGWEKLNRVAVMTEV